MRGYPSGAKLVVGCFLEAGNLGQILLMRKYPTSAKLVEGCLLRAGYVVHSFLMRRYPGGAKLVMGCLPGERIVTFGGVAAGGGRPTPGYIALPGVPPP